MNNQYCIHLKGKNVSFRVYFRYLMSSKIRCTKVKVSFCEFLKFKDFFCIFGLLHSCHLSHFCKEIKLKIVTDKQFFVHFLEEENKLFFVKRGKGQFSQWSSAY